LKKTSPSTGLILLALALALAGCGGSSGGGGPSLSKFKSGFAADKIQFRKLGLDLQGAITGAGSKTDAELASELGTLSGRARQQAGQLAELAPPANYRTGLNRLVSDFHSISSDLGTMSVAASKHEVAAAKAATKTLLRDAVKLKSSDAALTSALHLAPTA
jgi:hypothetical protein